MNWNKEQKSAIDERNKNLLVSASAGSGKTAVLVERILELMLSTKTDIDKFLVVTFTNAAAAEMKNKIAKRLIEQKISVENSDIDIEFLNRQISRVHMSQISTLHSFCNSLLREYYYSLNLDPNFRIASSQSLKLKSIEAIENVFDRHYEAANNNPNSDESKEFLKLTRIYSGYKNDNDFKDLIFKLYNFAIAQVDPIEWCDNVISGNNLYRIILDYLNEIHNQLISIKTEIATAVDICSADAGLSPYLITFGEDDEMIENLIKAVSGSAKVLSEAMLCDTDCNLEDIFLEQLLKVQNAFKNSNFTTLKRVSMKNEPFDENSKEIVTDIRKLVKKAISELGSNFTSINFTSPLERSIDGMHNYIIKVIEILKEYIFEYRMLKLSDNMLDFNDLEHLSIEILKDSKIADTYREKFKYIFVDEYQDTNGVQEKIISLIKSSDNLFLVGDVKQSIYGFRMADPGIFLNKYEIYKNESNSRKIDLNENYRSMPSVINAVNQVFSNLMTKEFGKIDYETDAKLIAGLKSDGITDHLPIIHLIDSATQKAKEQTDNLDDAKADSNIAPDGIQEDSSENLSDSDEDLSAFEMEINIAIKRIGELLKEDYYDYKSGVYKRITLNDIVILMRSISENGKTLQNALSLAGIASSIDEESSFFEIVEVATFIDLLRIIDNIRQDLPLLSVMRSAIGGFDDTEIAIIRTVKPKAMSYYEALLEFISDENTDDENLSDLRDKNQELIQKVKNFLDMIKSFRELQYMNLTSMINEILAKTGFREFVMGVDKTNRRIKHIDSLVEKANQFERENQTGIHHFVEYLDQLKNSKIEYGSKSNIAGAGIVRIMSIHKSKGLEFPVVFLMRMSKNFNKIDLREKILLNSQYGVASIYFEPDKRFRTKTMIYNMMKYFGEIKILDEEQRILYVAMTRAKARLECFCTVKKIDKYKNSIANLGKYGLSQKNNYTDWVNACVLGADNKAFEILEYSGVAPIDVNSESDFVKSPTEILFSNLLEAEPKKFQEININKSLIPSKISVSEIKRDISYDLQDGTFNISESLVENVDSGNILKEIEELILEKIDFRKSLHSTVLEPKLNNVKTVRFVGAKKGTAYHELIKEIFESNFLNNAVANHLYVSERFNISKTDISEFLCASKHISDEDKSYIYPQDIADFLNSKEFFELYSHSKKYVEKDFVYKLELRDNSAVLIQGIADFMTVHNNKITIVDYKTDIVNSAADLIRNYKIQLEIYALAISEILNLEIEKKLIYSFYLNKWIEV